MTKIEEVKRQVIFDAISEERIYQENKIIEKGWSKQKSIMEFAVIMEGELQEVKQAFLKGTIAEQLCEILQVISVGVACLEQNGICTREQLKELK